MTDSRDNLMLRSSRRLVVEGNNLGSVGSVGVCRPRAAVLYLRGHAARERLVVLQHQGNTDQECLQ